MTWLIDIDLPAPRIVEPLSFVGFEVLVPESPVSSPPAAQLFILSDGQNYLVRQQA